MMDMITCGGVDAVNFRKYC